MATMSIWTRISAAIAALANGEGLSTVFDQLRAAPDRSVAFAIAVIALGAKMAKADGQVTRDEVTAFREVFHIAPEDEAGAARVFDLARQDIAGFDIYAARIGAMYADDQAPLCDLMEGLFHIALSDGVYHPNEDEFLHAVAKIWGFDDRRFARIRAQFVPDAQRDAYDVIGVEPDAPMAEIRKAWKAHVRNNHPDMMTARGVPPEAIKLAEKRMVAINTAWAQIQKDRAL
jgi:DnaJ like chaperone protein